MHCKQENVRKIKQLWTTTRHILVYRCFEVHFTPISFFFAVFASNEIVILASISYIFVFIIIDIEPTIRNDACRRSAMFIFRLIFRANVYSTQTHTERCLYNHLYVNCAYRNILELVERAVGTINNLSNFGLSRQREKLHRSIDLFSLLIELPGWKKCTHKNNEHEQ